MDFRKVGLSGEQIRAARAILRLDQSALATGAGVSIETIKRLEGMRGPVEANTRTVEAIAAAFRRLGVDFDSRERAVGLWLHNAAADAHDRPA